MNQHPWSMKGGESMPIKIPSTDKIKFFNEQQELVGTLYLKNPMRFEGNVDESAKIFFEQIVKNMIGD